MSEDKTECSTGFFTGNPLEDIIHYVNILNKKFNRMQLGEFSKLNLTAPQYSVLMELWAKDAKPFKDLANACCCSRSTITGIVDTMEKNGFVKRETNKDDRREILVKLTTKGKGLEKSVPKLRIIMGGCCDGLEFDELSQLRYLLSKLNNQVIA